MCRAGQGRAGPGMGGMGGRAATPSARDPLACLPACLPLLLCPPAGITGAGAAGWRLPHLTAVQLQNSAGVDDAGDPWLEALEWGCMTPLSEQLLLFYKRLDAPKREWCVSVVARFVLSSQTWARTGGPLLTTNTAHACPLPAGVAALAGLPSLRALNLKQCKRVGNAGLAALAPRLPHLTALCLQVRQLLGGHVVRAGRAARASDRHLQHVAPAVLSNSSAFQGPGPARYPSVSRQPHSVTCPPPAPPPAQGMSDVSDEGVRHLAALTSLQDLELQFAWQVCTYSLLYNLLVKLSQVASQ